MGRTGPIHVFFVDGAVAAGVERVVLLSREPSPDVAPNCRPRRSLGYLRFSVDLPAVALPQKIRESSLGNLRVAASKTPRIGRPGHGTGDAVRADGAQHVYLVAASPGSASVPTTPDPRARAGDFGGSRRESRVSQRTGIAAPSRLRRYYLCTWVHLPGRSRGLPAHRMWRRRDLPTLHCSGLICLRAVRVRDRYRLWRRHGVCITRDGAVPR